jgi:DNA ligase-1
MTVIKKDNLYFYKGKTYMVQGKNLVLLKSPKKSRKSPRRSSKSPKKSRKSPKKSRRSPKSPKKSRRSSKSLKLPPKSPKKSDKKKTINKKDMSNDVIDKNNFTFEAMLAHTYSGENPVGYYLSEKLDGYRAIFYNGPKGPQFLSRNNKPFNAPKWFLEDIGSRLPKGTVLDGELYTKRGDFAGMGIVRKKIPVDKEWEQIVYMVFDMPLIDKPFRERYDEMQRMLKNIPHVHIVEHIPIESVDQFEKLHKKWVKEGAEGSMLRDPDSYYEHKRSKSLLKVKDFMDDEVEVVGMEYGTGKLKNVMGHLIVKWAPHCKHSKKYKGTFDIGSGFTDDQRKEWKKLYPPGTLLTIKYFEIQDSGKPRFPIFQNIYHHV